MRKVGLVGGLGPESTVEYYRGIIEAFKPTYDLLGYPEIAIESLNLKAVMSHVEKSGWKDIGALIAKKFEALRMAGADFGAMACNTTHIVFDEIQSQTFLPLQSIVDPTLNYAKQNNFEKLCLLGTKTTMNSDFYRHIFDKEYIKLVVPKEEEKEYIQEKLFSEIEFGIIKEETKANFLSIIDRIIKTDRVEGVILACTEMPLIIKPDDIDVAYIDTTQIHIASIVDICRKHEGEPL
jgi:aspartate racemase